MDNLQYMYSGYCAGAHPLYKQPPAQLIVEWLKTA